jgi:hypothetical protein
VQVGLASNHLPIVGRACISDFIAVFNGSNEVDWPNRAPALRTGLLPVDASPIDLGHFLTDAV